MSARQELMNRTPPHTDDSVEDTSSSDDDDGWIGATLGDDAQGGHLLYPSCCYRG